LTTEGSSRQVARHAALSVVGLVTIGLVRLAEKIGAKAFFGEQGLAWATASISIAALATVIGSAGLSAGITKLISQLRGSGTGRARQLAALVARVALALTLAGAVAGIIYSTFDPTLGATGRGQIVMVGVLTLVFGLYLAGKSILYGEEQVSRYVRAELLGGGLFVIGMVIIVVAKADWAVVIPLALAYVPVAWVSLSRLRISVGDWHSLPVRSLLGYGAVGSVGSLSGVGFTSATPLVAGFLAGEPGTALIGAALAVLEPMYLAPRAIGLALLPRLSFERAKNSQPSRLVEVSTGIAALAVAPFCMLFVLERDRVLQLLFGNQIVGGTTLAWFSAAFFVSVIGAPAVTSLAAVRVRDATIAMWSSIAGFATAAIIWLTLGPGLGTVAVAFGYCIGSVIQVVPPILTSTRRYGLAWGSLWLRLAFVSIGVAVAATLAPPGLAVDGIALFALAAVMLPEERLVRRLVARR
jgi:O-antigen/teichoic acid export membrane protein